MKTNTRLLCGSLLAALTLAAQAAGPLAPPAAPGNPAADMPSLVEIKAAIDALAGNAALGRTQIAGGTVGAGPAYTISQPGSYVLMGNISVGSGNGINISASGVTLDLNGFSIVSTANTLSGDGIHVDAGLSSLKDVVIKNGHVRGGSAYVAGAWIDQGFESGIRAIYPTADAVTVSHVQVTRCGIGIDLLDDVGFGGVVYMGTADHCKVDTVHNGGIFAETVTDCSVRSCGHAGIGGSQISNCVAYTFSSDLPSSYYAIIGNVVSYCIGANLSGGTAIYANHSAIGCWSSAGAITAASKHLGTP